MDFDPFDKFTRSYIGSYHEDVMINVYEKTHWSNPGAAEGFGVLHSEPYLSDNLFLFDDNSHQVVYIVVSLELVIVRTGSWSYSSGKTWDNLFIPNTIIRGIKAQ